MSQNNQKSITHFFKSNEKQPEQKLLQIVAEQKSSSQKSQQSQVPTDGIKINDGPFHPPADYFFPKSKSGDKLRSCQAHWFKKFSWLHYDEK